MSIENHFFFLLVWYFFEKDICKFVLDMLYIFVGYNDVSDILVLYIYIYNVWI